MSHIAIILVSESSLPLAQRIARSGAGDVLSREHFSASETKHQSETERVCQPISSTESDAAGGFSGREHFFCERNEKPEQQSGKMLDQVGHDAIQIYTKNEIPGCTAVGPYAPFLKEHWQEFEAVIFIGALGICVRSIAPALKNKYRDPAVVCIDSTGKYVIPVVSGHVGGANNLARHLASLIGAQAVVTTQSDNEGLWALDTLGRQFGWRVEATPARMNQAIFAFVERKPTALLLEVRDAGTEYLERTKPDHVQIFYRLEDLDPSQFALLIAVTPRLLPDACGSAAPESLQVLAFRPPELHL